MHNAAAIVIMLIIDDHDLAAWRHGSDVRRGCRRMNGGLKLQVARGDVQREHAVLQGTEPTPVQ